MNESIYMQRALALAKQGADSGEVPVGAVVVLDDEIIGEGYNLTISNHDPTAHAEIIALRDAAKTIGNYRLLDASLYVTLEPCPMCASAMVHARIKELFYATADPKTGVIDSQLEFLALPFLNHKIISHAGLCTAEASEQLKQFFKARREENALEKKS